VSHFTEEGKRIVVTTLLFVAALSACGGSGSVSPSPGASTPSGVVAFATPTATPAPRTCPTGARVGSALGITLPEPVGVPNSGGGTPLPAGAKGEACEYHAQSYNVIMELITNINPSYIAQFSAHFPAAYASVPGVGDQARSFSVSFGSGKVNEGLVATKGSTLVAIVVTAAPTSLSQIEALVNQLL
jgi:hypothetical protein